MAAQPELGLLPKRQFELGCNHPDRTARAWKDMTMTPSHNQTAHCVIAMAAS